MIVTKIMTLKAGTEDRIQIGAVTGRVVTEEREEVAVAPCLLVWQEERVENTMEVVVTGTEETETSAEAGDEGTVK